jgi:sulfur carrier protein
VNVTVNGHEQTVPDGATVDALLRSLVGERESPGSRGIAVAIEGEVVPRSRWGATELREGALVEVLTAVQGG